MFIFSKNKILERIPLLSRKEKKLEPADMDLRCFRCSFSVLFYKLFLPGPSSALRKVGYFVGPDQLSFLLFRFSGSVINILFFQVCSSGSGGDKYSKNLNNFP